MCIITPNKIGEKHSSSKHFLSSILIFIINFPNTPFFQAYLYFKSSIFHLKNQKSQIFPAISLQKSQKYKKSKKKLKKLKRKHKKPKKKRTKKCV